MQLKISLWNKTFAKKNLTRFWPVWAIELFFLLLVINFSSAADGTWKQNAIGNIDSIIGFVIVFGGVSIVFSIIAAMMIFGYLGDTKEAYLMHSFPVTRKTLFWSHYLSGLLMVLVPEIISYVILMIQIPQSGKAFPYFFAVFMQLLLGVFFCYSLACVSMLVTANRISGFVIYLVCNVLIPGGILVMNFVSQFVVYGAGSFDRFLDDVSLDTVSGTLLTILTPVYYWGTEIIDVHYAKEGKGYQIDTSLAGDNLLIFFIVIPAVLLLVAAYYLYKKRDIETAGEIVAFSWAVKVYKAVYIFFFSPLFVFGMMLLTGKGYGNPYRHQNLFVVSVVIAAVFGYLIVTMIMKKTFFIWKQLKPLSLFLSGFLMICLVLAVSMIGKQMPSAEEINYITVYMLPEYEPSQLNTIHISNKEDIKEFLELNKAFLNDPALDKKANYAQKYQVSYQMKDGRDLYKDYRVDPDIASVAAITEFCKNIYTKGTFFEGIDSIEEFDLSEVYKENEETVSFSSGTFEEGQERRAKDLLEALKKDAKAGTLIWDNDGAYRYEIYLEIRNGEKNKEEEDDDSDSYSVSVRISDKSIYTMQVVKRMVTEYQEILREESKKEQETLKQ